MVEFKTLDTAAFAAAGARGKQFSAVPRAVSARFDKRRHRVVVGLNTGLEFSFDPNLVQGLNGVAREDLVGVCIEGVGSTLRFPRLDADFTLSRLIEGFVGPMDWTKREARARASRANGRRGGRPARLAPATA